MEPSAVAKCRGTRILTIETISPENLRRLLRHRIAAAEAAGQQHVRDASGFVAHVVAVACCARAVAERLGRVWPPTRRPDPNVCFLAGAWHDAGKICNGDDYHEITSALELLAFAKRWELVRGRESEVKKLTHRAARAILPHFALCEQLHPDYAPTSGTRAHVAALCRELDEALGEPLVASDLLPGTTDAWVLIYSDLAESEDPTTMGGAAPPFEARWNDIECRARTYDPAIVPLLPLVKPRLHEAYEAVAAGLMHAAQADRRRAFHPNWRAPCNGETL